MRRSTWARREEHRSDDRGRAIGIISGALIVNPWDREILRDGRFDPHPEYVHALGQQAMTAPPSLLSGVAAREPAKKAL